MVSAAPPFSGLSKRVTEGRQAVSVAGLLPTGLARGDEVTVVTPDAEVEGTVVSARTDGAGAKTPAAGQPAPPADDGPDATEGDDDDRPAPVRAPTTDGGEGRLTVAVARSDVKTLLGVDRAKVVVESRGTRREYEAVSLLRRAGRRIRRLTVGAGSALAGRSVGAARVRETYGATVLAVRKPDGWQFAPGGGTTLDPDDELFAAGERGALEALGEALSGTRTEPEPGGGDD